MANNHADDPVAESLVLGMTATEMASGFRAATQRAVEEHLAAGRTVYGSYGTGQVYAIVPQPVEQDGSPAQVMGTAEPESRAS
jgi:hypothetical protein